MSFSGLPETKSEQVVSNDGFWPDLKLSDLQSRYRMPGEFEEPMVADHLQVAMVRINQQLSVWKEQRKAEGCATMLDAPADQLGEDKITLIHYRRAVFCLCKAMLLEQFPTINRRADAIGKDEDEETFDRFRELSDHAVADFLGRGRVNVELL